VKWLEVLANTVRKEFGNVLGGVSVLEDLLVMRLASKGIALTTGREPVDTNDLLLVGIHDRDKGQRVAVKVTIRIPIAGILGEDQSLKVAPVLVGQIQTAVRPGLYHDFKAFREFKLSNSLIKGL
jgi:hypothetical protein